MQLLLCKDRRSAIKFDLFRFWEMEMQQWNQKIETEKLETISCPLMMLSCNSKAEQLDEDNLVEVVAPPCHGRMECWSRKG